MYDVHYTPAELAKIAVSHLSIRRPGVIADMSAGEGSLLREAEGRWPSARIVATDIDRRAVRRLANMNRRRWSVGRCDFLANRSRSACRALREVAGKVDALLLNPPFSCRGGSYRTICTSSGAVRASLAMAFLLESLRYLSARGQAVAILPAGALHNQKDVGAWKYIRTQFTVQVLDRWDKKSFPGCAASSVLVKLVRSSLTPAAKISSRASRPSGKRLKQFTTIIRGTCPIHSLPDDPDGPTLVHYTDLRNKKVVLNGHRGAGQHRCLAGPAVLIPRVGRVTPDKVTLLDVTTPVMISDCVIGLKVRSLAAAQDLRRLIVGNFGALSRSYVGTGAPHITLGRLRVTLHRLGIGEHGG